MDCINDILKISASVCCIMLCIYITYIIIKTWVAGIKKEQMLDRFIDSIIEDMEKEEKGEEKDKK